MEITDLMLLGRFRQCAHIQWHRRTPFQGRGRILALLHERGPMTQRELTDLTQRRSATLSEQLEKMEKAGWIVREKSAADKRHVTVALTELGARMAVEAREAREQVAHTLFHAMNEDDRRRLYDLLGQLKELWEGLEECACQPTDFEKESGGL